MSGRERANERHLLWCGSTTIADARLLSAQARELREQGRHLIYLTRRSRQEWNKLAAETQQLIEQTETLLRESRNTSDRRSFGD